MDDHGFERVDRVETGYVIVCLCGWRTPAMPTAQTAGEAWDRHRDDVAA